MAQKTKLGIFGWFTRVVSIFGRAPAVIVTREPARVRLTEALVTYCALDKPVQALFGFHWPDFGEGFAHDVDSQYPPENVLVTRLTAIDAGLVTNLTLDDGLV